MKRINERSRWFDPTATKALNSLEKPKRRRRRRIKEQFGLSNQATGVLIDQLNTTHRVLDALSVQYGDRKNIPPETLIPLLSAYQDLKERFKIVLVDKKIS